MALRANAKIERIRKVPLFAECSRREVAEVAAIADELHLPAGRELIREGQRGRELFIVLEGEAEVRRKGRKVATVAAGDFVGELALVLDRPRRATITTTSATRVLVVTERSFRRLLRESPEIERKVLQTVVERLAPDVV